MCVLAGSGGVLRREYGSHGSIDVIASGPGAGPLSPLQNNLSTSESFFAMLKDYRPTVLDGRSPGAGHGQGHGQGMSVVDGPLPVSADDAHSPCSDR